MVVMETNTTKIRTYTELIQLATFEERFEYLKLGAKVGADVFGFERMFNQAFYRSTEWRRVRDAVIVRDGGCDLGVKDRLIYGRIIVHHINPITTKDLQEASRLILDPEFLISVSEDTHNAIHFGDGGYLERFKEIERKPNDTAPWKL